MQQRKANPSPESYTCRLLADPNLLHAKIIEEAHELVNATTLENTTFEAADVLFFVLVKCVQSGITLTDLQENLQKKHQSAVKRPGDAKEEYVQMINKKIKVEEVKPKSAPRYFPKVPNSTEDVATITVDTRQRVKEYVQTAKDVVPDSSIPKAVSNQTAKDVVPDSSTPKDVSKPPIPNEDIVAIEVLQRMKEHAEMDNKKIKAEEKVVPKSSPPKAVVKKSPKKEEDLTEINSRQRVKEYRVTALNDPALQPMLRRPTQHIRTVTDSARKIIERIKSDGMVSYIRLSFLLFVR